MEENIEFYDTIARYYDAENAEMIEDLGFYSALAGEFGGPVLDIGCGTGRVMLHLAQEGCRAVGIDLSEPMLARGRRKLDLMPDLKPVVTFVQADALDFNINETFKLIVVPYNGFMHFSEQADQLKALRTLSRHLAGDGLLVLDLPNAGEAFGTSDDSAVVLERTFIEPETGHLVMQQSVSALDRAAQQLHITWIYDEIGDDGVVYRTLAPLVLRYVFPGEMDLLLAAAGLRTVQTYGDYLRGPFEDGSPRMIILAQKIGKEGGE